MKKLFTLFLLIPILAQAQNATNTGGINFEHDKSWNEVVEKAKKENKYIMVDVFTTWCGPCKYMSQSVFTQPSVGDFYNAKFVNFKLQMDQTKNDAESVKKLYATAKDFEKKYRVIAYPTFLFFDSAGNVVHRIVGMNDAEAFINIGNDALNPQKQYFTLQKKYNSGEIPDSDTAFLRNYALAAQAAYDQKTQDSIGSKYIEVIKSNLTKDNLNFITTFTQSTKSAGFPILLSNYKLADRLLGANAASEKIKQIITMEDVYKYFSPSKTYNAKVWDTVNSNLQAQYPEWASDIVQLAQVQLTPYFNDWTNYFNASQQYLSKNLNTVPSQLLNEVAWNYFLNTNDKSLLQKALALSKKATTTSPESAAFMDTYANLFYKLGNKERAIALEEKAISLLTASDNKLDYEKTLAKMKKGEKTW